MIKYFEESSGRKLYI